MTSICVSLTETTTEATLARMAALGLGDVPVIVGGIIPPDDAETLKAAGVAAVYTPKDFQITAIINDVVGIVEGTLERAA